LSLVALGSDKPSLHDLKAFASHGEWEKVLLEANKIPAEEKKEIWQKVVEQAAVNLLSDPKAQTQAETLESDYRFLLDSPAYQDVKRSLSQGVLFEGTEGRVTIVGMSDKKTILYIESTNSEMDGVWLLHQVEVSKDKTAFKTKWKGATFLTLEVSGSDWKRARQASLWTLNKNASTTLYRKNQKVFGEPYLRQFYGKKDPYSHMTAKEVIAKANEWEGVLKDRCKKNIKIHANVEAPPVEARVMCEDSVRAVLSLCHSDGGREKVSAKLSEINCAYANKEVLKLQGEKLVWNFSESSIEREIRIREYLQKSLIE